MAKRKRLAIGGVADDAQGGWWQRNKSEPVQGHGLVPGASNGRADTVNVSVPSGAYVVPADIVAALGAGNTANGAQALERVLQSRRQGFAHGGATKPSPLVPVKLSGGEYVVDPLHVMAIGGGDLDYGHDVLDAFVLKTRKQNVEKLKKLPPPVRE